MKKILFALCLCFLFTTHLRSQTYLVGHTQITFNDPSRGGRSIQTEIYYPSSTAGNNVPVSTGSFPLIVFGHGFVMSWDAYQNFWDELVPRGYIIAFPRTEGNFSPVHSEFGKDLAFLNTKIQSESSVSSSLFYNHLSSKTAIMGHSMGGGCSFLAAANNNDITTMVSFAAANTNPSSIAAAADVGVPALVFSGENDCVAPSLQHQQPMYDSLASTCKAFISIKGAAHCEFANYNVNCSFGQSTCSPQPAISGAAQKDAVNDFLDLWLDYYLKDDCSAINNFNDSLILSQRINYNKNCADDTVPVIQQSGSVLQSTPATTYQWYYNGAIIPGETSQSLSVSLSGTYYVIVTYSSVCGYQSNSIVFNGMSVSENEKNIFAIYPNPASSEITLSSSLSGKAVLSIYNLTGELLQSNEVIFLGNIRQKINESIRSGIYFIEVKTKDCREVQKLIIE